MALDAIETSNCCAFCVVKVTSASVTMDTEECIIDKPVSSDYRKRHAQICSPVFRQLIEIRWYDVHETILIGLSMLPYVSIVAQPIKRRIPLTVYFI
jgi:hypothetical protein